MTKKKLKYFLIFNLITFLITFSSSQILAKSKFSFALCEYSQEYEKWLELSPVDQANNIEPVMCKAMVVSQKREPYLDYSNIFKTFYTFAAADSSYDLRTIGGVTAVRNQGNNSNCWAYATMASLESYLLINQYGNFDFSERHMDYATIKTFNNSEINQEGFNRELTEGGNILMASAYLMRNSGPIDEQEMPHSNDYGLIDILEIQNKTNLVDVNEIAFFTNSNYSESNCGPGISLKIKEHLSTYGALFANLYMLDDIPYYNSSSAAYYYNGSQMANHSVAIVGWDDNYSKANFIENNQPSRNGAWLVKNSYGNVWGDSGYFYVSYDDPHLCDYLAGITSADEELDDNSYYHDPLGANAYLETEEGSQNYLYGANIFTKKTIEEQLTEVVIMNPVNTLLNYEVYVNAKAREQNEESDEAYLNSPNKELVATGSVNYSGYYTVKLEDPVDLLAEEFAIIVRFIYPTTNQAFLAISIDNPSSNEWYEYLTSPGNSFLSSDMNNWQDA